MEPKERIPGVTVLKKVRLLACFAAIVMLAASIPLVSLATTATVISNDVLFLRPGPGMDNDPIGKYRPGTKVTVLYNGYRNWVRVRTPDGKTGYMYRNYLSSFSNSSSGSGSAPAGSVRYIKSSNGGPVNLRQRASTRTRLMDRMPVGARVTVLSSGSTWTRVLYKGKDGWVMTKFLSKSR